MENLVPSAFYLCQNSPNPVKELTKIKYCLPVKAKVIRTLFNSQRETMKELVNKVQKAGTYEVVLDSCNLPDGMYTYQLRAVDSEISSRQLFIKKKKLAITK